MTPTPPTRAVRRALRVAGVVQGVGFRPFAFRLASSLGLAGHVGNDAAGVFCEVEGPAEAVEAFTRRLVADAPPLARIESVGAEDRTPTGEIGFTIVASRPSPGALTLVAPDLAPCDACLGELTDPADRRYRYPLLNCTDCGPRFTITTDVPYDRPSTTMAAFAMCAACRAEYDDPADRRFHAQPTACGTCGPRVWLESPVGVPVHDADPVRAARAVVVGGGVLAVKGVGGYHLACRADLDDAVAALRSRKSRPDKPFAVMVADLGTARAIARVDDGEAALLEGPERPIVLVTARPGSVSSAVAPGNGFLGVTVPPSPLHALLVEPGEVWVMTSGNRSGEPICTGDDEARDRLGGIADAILGHDRPIAVPCDDSVVRVVDVGSGPSVLPLRRSRGYAPYPVPLDLPDGPPVLAVGGELKATACLRRGGHAFMSQHVGDMGSLEVLAAFERAVDHMSRLFRTDPEVLVCDAHPGYASAAWARRHAGGRPVIAVQHHHAHLASLLAEHRRAGPIIGFSFDGTGYGTDDTIWGGEVLLADLAGLERVGHLRPSALAGGDAAVERPYRQALARLAEAGLGWDGDLAPVAASGEDERRVLATQLERGLGVVATSSMGRLLDALSALCGVRQVISYEGQAAIELEALVDADEPGSYRFAVGDDGVWDPRPVVAAVVSDVRIGTPVGAIAARIHAAVRDGIVVASQRVRATHGLDVVGLSGGVFQNVVLTTAVARALAEQGFEVLTHRLVPPNDGGLALGQVAVAAAQLAR
ncbi:carbamoyltransferase HypF [Euzebya sp.]|uniref:carbamoyltransferase HypF n=1 Tax=Euzebya sp. TaxID=1971409 RepID=UPI003511B877